MFDTLKEAQTWIESVYRFGDKYDLSRMEKAVAMLGHPEKQFKSIHIGGTNGKGSTLTYLKHMLMEAGYSVGTYTSPYVVRFNERITLNGDDIDDATLLEYINRIYAFDQRYLDEHNDQISFFELVTLIALLYFADAKPDIALIEVGLGGTLDATNVIVPLLSVITNIGTDHLHVIGPTLADVAKNKLGIVKPGVPLITAAEQPDLWPLFEATCEQSNSALIRFDSQRLDAIELGMPTRFSFGGETYAIHMAGLHQVHNAALALTVIEALEAHHSYAVPDKAKKNGLSNAFWPGRFEIIGNVILDGAHNIEGLTACLKTVKAYYPNHRVTALFTVMADKDYQPMLEMLSAHVDRIVFTEIDHPRAEKASVLKANISHPDVHAIPSLDEALEKNRPKDAMDLLIVTGSLYFISEVRKRIKK